LQLFEAAGASGRKRFMRRWVTRRST